MGGMRSELGMLFTAPKVIAWHGQKGVAAVVPTQRASSLLQRPPSSTYPRRTSSPCSSTPITTARSGVRPRQQSLGTFAHASFAPSDALIAASGDILHTAATPPM